MALAKEAILWARAFRSPGGGESLHSVPMHWRSFPLHCSVKLDWVGGNKIKLTYSNQWWKLQDQFWWVCSRKGKTLHLQMAPNNEAMGHYRVSRKAQHGSACSHSNVWPNCRLKIYPSLFASEWPGSSLDSQTVKRHWTHKISLGERKNGVKNWAQKFINSLTAKYRGGKYCVFFLMS